MNFIIRNGPTFLGFAQGERKYSWHLSVKLSIDARNYFRREVLARELLEQC